jgi:hypothetical protein
LNNLFGLLLNRDSLATHKNSQIIKEILRKQSDIIKFSNSSNFSYFLNNYIIKFADDPMIYYPHCYFGLIKVLIQFSKTESDINQIKEFFNICMSKFHCNEDVVPTTICEVSTTMNDIFRLEIDKFVNYTFGKSQKIIRFIFMDNLSQTINEFLCLYPDKIVLIF